jgi:hypothetical protein
MVMAGRRFTFTAPPSEQAFRARLRALVGGREVEVELSWREGALSVQSDDAIARRYAYGVCFEMGGVPLGNPWRPPEWTKKTWTDHPWWKRAAIRLGITSRQ